MGATSSLSLSVLGHVVFHSDPTMGCASWGFDDRFVDYLDSDGLLLRCHLDSFGQGNCNGYEPRWVRDTQLRNGDAVSVTAMSLYTASSMYWPLVSVRGALEMLT
jgi:hypothetical protein